MQTARFLVPSVPVVLAAVLGFAATQEPAASQQAPTSADTSASREAGGSPTPVVPCVALSGADSEVAAAECHRVTNLADWAALWLKHLGRAGSGKYDLYYDKLGLPLVDFDRYMVMAIFEGQTWNCAGLTAVSIEENPDRVVLRFVRKSYQTLGPDGGGRKVTPYGFFVVPRSTKRFVIEEDVHGLIGGAPEWKERATFPALPPG